MQNEDALVTHALGGVDMLGKANELRAHFRVDRSAVYR